MLDCRALPGVALLTSHDPSLHGCPVGAAFSSPREGVIPIGPILVPFWGSYLESYKVYNPKKELLWSLWV